MKCNQIHGKNYIIMEHEYGLTQSYSKNNEIQGRNYVKFSRFGIDAVQLFYWIGGARNVS